jgi:hypothetical protein
VNTSVWGDEADILFTVASISSIALLAAFAAASASAAAAAISAAFVVAFEVVLAPGEGTEGAASAASSAAVVALIACMTASLSPAYEGGGSSYVVADVNACNYNTMLENEISPPQQPPNPP